MIPESSDSHELWLYSCEKFPFVWKKHHKISNDCVADATPFFTDDSYILFATKFDDIENRQNDNLAVLRDSDTKFEIVEKNLLARPAGHFIKLPEGKCIRPSQNNTRTYGGNLIFNEVNCNAKTFQEQPIMQVYPDRSFADENGVVVRCAKKTYWNYSGIHTYNANEDYEVIDIKYNGGKSIYALISFLKNKYLHSSK